MKIVSILLVTLLCLTGCTKIDNGFSSELANKINTTLNEEASAPYYSHGYYSYNIEANIGRIDSSKTSNTFSYNGTKFIMNLNIPSILGLDTSNEILNSDSIIYETNGSYNDFEENSHNYTLKCYSISDDIVLYVNTDTVSFYSVCSKNEASSICSIMLDIARSVKINEEKIKNDYSSHDTISYQTEELELFKNIVPESGAVDELFETTSENESTFDDNVDGVDGDYSEDSNE